MKAIRPFSKRKSGRIFVVSGPSGSGKTTLVKRLFTACKKGSRAGRLLWSVSVTTRKPRKVERHKRDYIFVSKKEFLSRRASGEFLEWARVGDEYYATPKGFAKRQIESGNHVLLTIDVQGARQVKKKFPGAILIFILPPSLAALHRRLSHRSTESDAQIKRRLKLAKKEIAQAKHYDFVVINHKLEKAAEALRRIIHDELYTDR